MATADKRIDQLDPVSVLDLTSLLAMQQGTEARKVTLQQLLNYLNDNVDTKNVVLYVAQTLTEEQKLQARTNIGAAATGEGGSSAANAVLYVAQTLTEDQQHQARLNIRCGGVGEVAANCVASGEYSHAEGNHTKALEDHSHAEGGYTTASGFCTHAEGYYTKASGGFGPHAEGYYTTASGGNGSHAEGYYTTASGSYGSHAEGCYTKATRKSQHVQGEYNVEDVVGTMVSVRGKYAHIVGNGTADNARSNAHTLDWDGVPWFAGNRVMLGGTGMDDEAAVALMPIFVAQTLTAEQKAQARANIGVDEYINEVFLGGEW